MRKDVVSYAISGLRLNSPKSKTKVVEDQPPESTTDAVDRLPKRLEPDTGVFG